MTKGEDRAAYADEEVDDAAERLRRMREHRGGRRLESALAPELVAGAWVFGTDASCDRQVVDAYASPRHCVISYLRDGTAAVEDLGSTNGTFIVSSGQVDLLTGRRARVRRRVEGVATLAFGDSVQIGRTELPWTRR